MKPREIKDRVLWVGAVDWDRRLFDALIPLPDGTSYNAYLIEGSEKTVLVDTVDPGMAGTLMAHLSDVDNIDFVVSHHSEQDHSGTIPAVLDRYKDAKVITSPKGKGLLVEHLHIPGERIITVADEEPLSLGGKTLEFLHTPWVHWPETMITYLREDKILFSCDLFGSHLAASGLYADEDWRVCEAAKRYYAEVMMPFRSTIKKHLDRFDSYDIDIIAPSHGPIYKDPGCIIRSHKEWVSDYLANTVVIPYVSMHGSTELMVDHLTEILSEAGVRVERFNLTVADTGKMAMATVDAATIVMGSPTVLAGAHPLVVSAAFMVNALRPKLKFASIIGSCGWGGKMVDQLSGTLSGLKVDMLDPVIIQGKPKVKDYENLDRLASEIITRHGENNIF